MREFHADGAVPFTGMCFQQVNLGASKPHIVQTTVTVIPDTAHTPRVSQSYVTWQGSVTPVMSNDYTEMF